MDFERILSSIARHWVAVFFVLVLTAVAVVVVPGRIAPDYEVKGAAMLLPPSTTLGPNTNLDEPVSPWSRLSVNEEKAAVALVEILNGPEASDAVYEDPGITDYSVTSNADNSAILNISVVAGTGESALDGFDKVVQILGDELQSRQEASGAPADTWLRGDVLTRPDTATEQPGSKTRAIIATGVLGLVVAVGVAIALDVIVEPRRRRKAEEAEAEEEEQQIEDAPEDSDDAVPQDAPSTLVLRRTAGNRTP